MPPLPKQFKQMVKGKKEKQKERERIFFKKKHTYI